MAGVAGIWGTVLAWHRLPSPAPQLQAGPRQERFLRNVNLTPSPSASRIKSKVLSLPSRALRARAPSCPSPSSSSPVCKKDIVVCASTSLLGLYHSPPSRPCQLLFAFEIPFKHHAFPDLQPVHGPTKTRVTVSLICAPLPRPPWHSLLVPSECSSHDTVINHSQVSFPTRQ